ncbi:MAG: chitobiase/beta-hexosaminidase C-terminal domain-containing protein [Muribaculaceae bacterium]|nr:chitobiase/beta-hexosaminidase C-terminal domain-containing protein [Muribaculaceae bacterium]
MKKFIFTILTLAMPVITWAQGWPANYGGVMLQGFYWESFNDTRWTNLTNQADELSQYFDLIWLPQSGSCGGSSMGYDPLYFFNQSSAFGTEAQLRTLISTLKSKGTGCIADVVLNHHKAVTGWLTFPKETYNGTEYQLLSTDICKNDDGGETLTWANTNGFTLSNNYDTGEDWSGCRDLDHKSSNVQKIVKAYLKFLLNDLGYMGFRYDMARGFSPSFFGQYNAYANPTFSVGEHWTNSTQEIDWMNGTSVNGNIMSGVFDFDFRYTCRNAFNSGIMTNLNQHNGNDNNWPLVSNANQGYLLGGFYRRYAVTFLENHDLQDRGNVENYNADPLKRDTVAANAYMMAMPGTPCVFLTHWKDCKQDIKGLIDVRKAVGITNTSNYSIINQAYNAYAIETYGSDNKKLVTVVGGKPSNYTPDASQYTLIVDGYHYRYFMSRNMETAWIDKASGYYAKAQNVRLTAVSQSNNAQLVYTTDGSTPTATNGTKVASGYVLRLREPMTLKVGLLINNTVKGIQTRVYDLPNIPDFEPHTATVYFADPSKTVATWTDAYIWAYDGNGNMYSSWPGKEMTDTVTIKNVKFYYSTYEVNDEDYTFSFVLTNSKGTPQTIDYINVNKDIYVQLGTLNGVGKYNLTNVTRIYEKSNPLNQIPGDVDGDGKVDVSDVNAIINIILEIKPASYYKGNADLNKDGKVDIEDVNADINIILTQ